MFLYITIDLAIVIYTTIVICSLIEESDIWNTQQLPNSVFSIILDLSWYPVFFHQWRQKQLQKWRKHFELS